ncbi:zf-HC2 domain-containing protein [uncultured Paludibaculum sp.]|uniref:anti-sigma factor n=1 Tax=uncultured Paludibaculum sp. TaxID=1765020 RepID=UPI002AAC2DCD|nr:zf-HC2 domain-containing protein [uncultured Paludibaculum sp.]
MTCPSFDWKSYILDEITAPERRQMEQHLTGCAHCREEVDGLRLTVTALRRLPVQEIPKRISFVSDPVFEPSGWQRFWNSASRLGFASAAMLAGAILLHGYMIRPVPVTTTAGLSSAQIEEQVQVRVNAEVARLLPTAVDQRVQAQLKPAMAELSARLQEVQASSEKGRVADQRLVADAFTVLEKRYNTMFVQANRYGGD